MGNPVTLQRLLAMQKKIWRFRLDSDAETAETVAREQLKSIGQISRIGSLISIPGTSYILIKIGIYADWAFTVFTLFCVAVMAFASVRNYRRQTRVDHDRIDYEKSVRMIVAEAKLNAAFASALVAVPLAFAQIPMGLDVAILGIGTVILGGFIFGSIPQAQSWYMGISTLIFVGGVLAAEGTAALGGVALFIFVALCTDYIYRMFFFNFVQRHVHAAREKKAADTVRLLLHDYAEQSSDWLWEVDSEFRIINPSARFASAAAREIRDLRGRPLFDLFEDSTERNFLMQSLESGEAFRDLPAPINIHGKLFWWKLSGRPTPCTHGSQLHIRGVAADITRAKMAEERVAHLAHFDSLTDLPNRALFNQSLQRSIARLRPDQKLAVLYLDLDNFKNINDTLGHGAGDLVLKAVANRLEEAIGVEDVVARLGGDEFAISLRHITSDADAKRKATAIIRKLSEPIMIEGQPVISGASIGIAMCASSGSGSDELLKFADIALYHAKNNGRGCVSIFEESMGTAFQDRRDIEIDLRSALQREELELRYQPLVNIDSGETIGYEALLRWHHPERGLIMPNAFIPVAEETGMIVQLGEWVLRSALEELCNWPEHLSVAVNLSPSQMRSPNLIPTIVNALAATRVDPARLELEITESVLMSDSQNNVELLHKIRSLGVRIALDDFGTGYSSLNYLRSFPFDKIKIDRCFVEDVDSREDCRAIIRAVTGLASSLGMVTTAEGVERNGQLDQLKEDGCVQVQGYLFSKAMPATKVKGRVAPEHEFENPASTIAVEEEKRRRADRPDTARERKAG